MFVCFKKYNDHKCHAHQNSRNDTCHKHIRNGNACDGCIYDKRDARRDDNSHGTRCRHQCCGERCGKSSLLYHCRNQYSTESCYGSRTGTGDCSKETGNNNAYDRNTTFFVSNAGIYKIDQSAGNSGFCHDISGQYEERNCQKKELTDSRIHICRNNSK